MWWRHHEGLQIQKDFEQILYIIRATDVKGLDLNIDSYVLVLDKYFNFDIMSAPPVLPR